METELHLHHIEDHLRACRPPLSVKLLDEISSFAWSTLNETEVDSALDIALRLVAESILFDAAGSSECMNARFASLVKAMNSMKESAILQKNDEFQNQMDKFFKNLQARDYDL